MRILIDADGCPVITPAIALAARYGVELVLLCDTSHVFDQEGIQVITVSKGADSVDFVLVNLLQKGDLVVTQDYGLAAMCLARQAVPVNQDGMRYTEENIDALLLARDTARRIRKAGGRLKGSAKRTAGQDAAFAAAFEEMIREGIVRDNAAK